MQQAVPGTRRCSPRSTKLSPKPKTALLTAPKPRHIFPWNISVAATRVFHSSEESTYTKTADLNGPPRHPRPSGAREGIQAKSRGPAARSTLTSLFCTTVALSPVAWTIADKLVLDKFRSKVLQKFLTRPWQRTSAKVSRNTNCATRFARVVPSASVSENNRKPSSLSSGIFPF